MIRRALLRIRSALLRRRHEREMQEEMAEHLERATARLRARGMPPAEARRAAEREFGNVAWLQEQARDAWGTAWLDALVGDVRFALRQYGRRPATTLVMFVVLVVGLSVTTLLFYFVHSYATQPPPGMVLTEDMVRIRGSQSAGEYGRGTRAFSEEELVAYTQLTDHFAAVAGWTAASVALDAGAAPEQRDLEARVTFVTGNYFSVLGVVPLLGPGLATTADAARATTAVISHGTWERLFGRDPDIIGRTVTLNGVAVTIVGVGPERFTGVAGWGRNIFWMPLAARDALLAEPPTDFRAAGRLRPGVTPAQASAATHSIAIALAASAAAAPVDASAATSAGAAAGLPGVADPSTEVVPLRSGSGDPMFERDVKLLSAAVGLLALLVLLITATNVSALLTGLATARRHEIAIRLSLGAARMRLIRQLLTESALLAGSAAAVAVLLVWSVLRAAPGFIADLPIELRVRWPATLFAFGIALAVGVLFGLSPALHATRLAVAGVLRDASANLVATRARLQRGLVVAQIAFTQPLTVLLAALLILVLGEFQPAPRSEFADRIVAVSMVVRVAPGTAEQADVRAQLSVASRELAERLRATPGVMAVTTTWPGSNRPHGYTAAQAGAPASGARDVVALSLQHVDAGYFDVMGIPLVRGRTFTPDDVTAGHATTPIPTVIDIALAREIWRDADPIGREFHAASDIATGIPPLVVVGVVDHPPSRRSVAGIDHFVFLPPDTGRTAGGLYLRTAAPARTLLPALRSAAQEDAQRVVVGLRILADIADEKERNFRLAATGVSIAGLLALLLAAIGLYAVIAFSVGQRTREIAVRMAIGGARPQIVRRFVLDGLRLCAIGLVVGLPVSLFALRTLMSEPGVPQIGLTPVSVLAAASVVVVATLAAWLPARRAAAVDPAVTLRSE
jgi:predicted permease